jgi:hypothetical protein
MQSYYLPVVFVTTLVGDVAVFSAAVELVNCTHGKTGLVEAFHKFHVVLMNSKLHLGSQIRHEWTSV